jgi:4-hydroxybenzoate polyprenyltransferase and related prenyltransferases
VILVLLYMGYDKLWEWLMSHRMGIRYNYPRVPLSERIKAMVANARPYTLILPLFGGWFVIQASLGRLMIPTPDPALTIAALLSLMLINAAGNYWNSIYDLEIDRINKPYRPLPSGRLTVREARIIAVALTWAALALAALVGRIFLALASAAMLLTFLYSAPVVRLKSRLWINNVTQAAIRGVLGPLAAWTVYSSLNARILAVAAVMFVLITAGQSVKDIPDVRGDAAFGIRTLPVVYGVPFTYRVVAAGAALDAALIAALSLMGMLPWGVLIVYAPLAASLVYFTLHPRSTITENQLSWTIFYLTMVGVLFGFTLGSWGILPRAPVARPGARLRPLGPLGRRDEPIRIGSSPRPSMPSPVPGCQYAALAEQPLIAQQVPSFVPAGSPPSPSRPYCGAPAPPPALASARC